MTKGYAFTSFLQGREYQIRAYVDVTDNLWRVYSRTVREDTGRPLSQWSLNSHFKPFTKLFDALCEMKIYANNYIKRLGYGEVRELTNIDY